MNNFLKKASFVFMVFVSFLFLLGSCVPIRNQLVLTDKSKYSLKQKQLMDTIVDVTPYEYKIRKGDILSVEIVSITPGEYSMGNAAKTGGDVPLGYLVNDSGYVDIPILGLVKVAGQTVEQSRSRIKLIASEYLNNVTVSVRLLNFVVDVFGEKAGSVTSPDGKLSVIQAIAQINGIGQYINVRRVKIIRQIEGGNKIHVFYVDISDVGIINRPEYFLMPKDILVLEPLKAKNAPIYQKSLSYVTASISVIVLIFSLRNKLAF